MNDAVSITVLGREYPLKLSVNAMQEIEELYGGVDKAATDLVEAKNVFERLRISIKLVSILATEGARSHNYEHPDEEKIPDLPVAIAGTVLTVADLNDVSPKIIKAFNIGMGRTIFSEPTESEDDEKNTEGA